jgi:Xaa-Pro aminopeptidase
MALFALEEYQTRWKKAQSKMKTAGLDGLLLTQEVDFAYFAGFHTRFWQSPTRPWFLVLPQSGNPIAVIPSIGEHLMRQGVVDNIKTWSAPDLNDDGIGILSQTINNIGFSNIGLPYTMESHLRMPLADFQALQEKLPTVEFRDDANIARDLRMIKSQAEVARIEQACSIAGKAFARVPQTIHKEQSLAQIFRKFQIICLEEGADFIPYLAGALEASGYNDVISPAHDVKGREGDVLMLDTGLIRDGYFCDFNRNFAIGKIDPMVRDAHKILTDVTELAIEHMKIGTAISAIYDLMQKALTQDGFKAGGGRLGHGLGLYLTEWPSIIADEYMPLSDNMVMTIEPSIEMPNGKILVHEDNVVITAMGAKRLTPYYGEMEII